MRLRERILPELPDVGLDVSQIAVDSVQSF